MTHLEADIAILGAGFGGSLSALILHRLGLRVVLLDRGRHPRFAIGESSTPIADLILRDLALRYDLPRLLPLAKYGTWQAAYPEVVCGLKRGFSYFEQVPGERFTPRGDHANELLVAASHDDARSDTHWLRSDVDTFLAGEVVREGIPYFDETAVSITSDRPWRFEGDRCGETLSIEARFVIDATGEGGLLARHLGLRDVSEQMQTHSRSLFAHFAGVKRWGTCLQDLGARLDDHPFPCDAAAQHQVLPQGWMWQLRFDNDVTSLGFMLDTRQHPFDPSVTAQEEWDQLLRRYPSIGDQLRDATLVAPSGGLRRTGRIQRRLERVAGPDWALLPHTAGFVDPLNSTGIAHTLCGIERLALMLERHWGRDTLPGEMESYSRTVGSEIEFIDELIAGCYDAFPRFPVFVDYSMLYFAMVTSFEHRRAMGELPPGAAFFGADDPERRTLARRVRRELRNVIENRSETGEREFSRQVAREISPYNIAGLCNPLVQNMYRYTAADKGQ